MDVRLTDRRHTSFEPVPPSTPLRGAVAAGRVGVAAAAARARAAVSPDAVRALSRPSPESRIAARLDRFYSEMRATYQVDGRQVVVSPRFLSNKGRDEAQMLAARAKIEKLVGKEKFAKISIAAAHATGTRGTAADVKRTVQAMIDAGGLRPYASLPADQAIRRMMSDHQIGLDCRGYVGRAFLYARGLDDKPASAERFGLEPSEFVIPSGMFDKVPIDQARAGDWLRLKPDSKGRDHNVIVRSNEVRSFSGPHMVVSGKSVPRAFAEDGWPPGSTPSVRVMEVDSSWGGGGNPEFGGVERRVWVHNAKSGLWGYWDSSGELQFSKGPYAHELDSVYRPVRER